MASDLVFMLQITFILLVFITAVCAFVLLVQVCKSKYGVWSKNTWVNPPYGNQNWSDEDAR